jgi:glucokinase
MSLVLAADIGGTKSLLQLSTAAGEVVSSRRYESREFDGLDAILEDFLAPHQAGHIAQACLAVAGPVMGITARVTNLPWQLDAADIEQRFAIDKVLLCNDFEAAAQGIEGLQEDDVFTLQAGDPQLAPRAIIGAGTGLGQAYLVPQASVWQVVATEGGHTDFAPTDLIQVRLFEQLHERFGHVSYERLLSGEGLKTIYHFLRDYLQLDENAECRLAMVQGDAAAAISEFARAGDELALEAMQLFFAIYGAQAGNLALTTMPRGGLYIAGGIAAKNQAILENSAFMSAFLAKGRMQPLLENVPVKLILQHEVALIGARLLAAKAMYN